MQNKNNFNKNRRSNNNGNRGQNFDSNGPTGRIKGSAKQISDKYQSMARDAYASGDNISMENFYQHAEHYFRINNYIHDQAEQKRKARDTRHTPKTTTTEEPKKVTAQPAKKEAVETVKEEKVVKKTRRNTTKKTKIGSKKEVEVENK